MVLGTKFDYEIEQLDIITAFFEFLIKKTLYLDQPHRFEEPKDTSCARVCHLFRALYGLQQSPQEWYLTLVDYLKSFGYKHLKHDHYVLVHQNGIKIAIYLDDVGRFRPDLAKIG